MFAIPQCAGLYIGDMQPENFESICQTVKNQFAAAEEKPEGWDEWIKNAVFDEANHEIRVAGNVNPQEYGPFLAKCIDGLAAQYAATFRGFYDLYNGNFGSGCSLFAVTCGEVEWIDGEDVDLEFASASLIDTAAENGYDFNQSLSLASMISFVRELATDGNEDALEAIDSFKSCIF